MSYSDLVILLIVLAVIIASNAGNGPDEKWPSLRPKKKL